MRSCVRRFIAGVPALGLAFLLACDPVPPGMRAVAVDVRVTSFGIPHIKAADWVSLGYGAGFAYARDNICILAREIVTATGEEARYFGPSESRLRRSFLFTLLSEEDALLELLRQQPVEIQELTQGYVAGYNRWLERTGVENLPEACRGEPWVRPIDIFDLAAVYVKGNARGSVDPLQRAIFGASPPIVTASLEPAQVSDAGEAAVEASAPAPGPAEVAAAIASLPKRIDQLPGLQELANVNRHFPGGSNAYGIGGDLTVNGRGMLLGNPHEPWNGISRFYQLHLDGPGDYNVMGVTQIALPLVVIGFNEHIAWSHTISTSKRFTIYELALDPADDLVYLYENDDGVVERRDIEPIEVEIEVLGEDQPRTHVFYKSHFGFMLGLDSLTVLAPAWGDDIRIFGGPESVAYTMRDVNEENPRPIEQWFSMDQATSVPDLKDRMNALLGMPFVNTIAADSQGNAFYADIGAVPHVTEAKFTECLGSGIMGLLAASGVVGLDGSRIACEWGGEFEGQQDGILGPELLPSLIRRDYVTNSNDSYWLSNPDDRLEGFAPVLRRDVFNEQGPRLLRTRIGIIQVQDRAAGVDGLPGTLFDLPILQQVFYGNRNYSAELELDRVVADCQSGVFPQNAWPTSGAATVDVTQACALLAAWDRTDNIPSVGVAIWRQFFRRLGRDPSKFENLFDVNDPVNTPNTLRITGATRVALGDAVKELNDLGIPLDAALGDIQYVTSDDGPRLPDDSNVIPMHGGLGQNGVFNVVSTPDVGVDGYTPVRSGPTYMQTVTWDDDGNVVAEAILGFSQSDDPESPHFSDQTERYSTKEFIRLPFTEAEIAADLVDIETLTDLVPFDDF